MKVKSSSILKKTLIYLIAFCASILILLWIFEIYFFKISFLVYQNEIGENVNQHVLKNNLNDLEYEKLAYENNLCLMVVDPFGQVKEFNNKMTNCKLESPQVLSQISDFIKGDSLQVKYKFQGENKGLLYGIKKSNKNVLIYISLKETKIINKLFRSQLIYIILLAIIIASALAIFLSNLITKPIRLITKKALNIGKENYNNHFEKTGIIEIDELSETLDAVQMELGKVQTYQKDLLANVTHDLKTPLTMIKAYTEKIRDISYKDKDKLDQDVQIVISEVDRLTLLVNDILNNSKVSNQNINIEVYDIIHEIKNILEKYQIIKETENYFFEVNLPKEPVYIKADKQKINQVIYNLINNAINYTGDDKLVKISLEKEKNKYIFKVTDTGKGIKPKDIDNIWTKYYKNDKNHQRNVISTGLGLSIVKSVLEQHHLEYGVNSKIKQGSTFYFKFSPCHCLPKVDKDKTRE